MLWIKAFHIVFVVAWFAGLLYLPRLFVYHAECDDAPGHARFEVMERRLFAIMSVGAIATIALGVALLMGRAEVFFGSGLWLHVKLALVAILVVYHLYCAKIVADFRLGKNRKSATFFRLFNEIPAVILIFIAILAVVRPI